MKIELFVLSLLLVIGASIGGATAMESVNPFTVPDNFSSWPNVTAPTRLPGLNPFGHEDIVIPTPTDTQDYDPGVRWERPVRTDWINQTSITSGLNQINMSANNPVVSSRLSKFL